jgi:hypothetical protein
MYACAMLLTACSDTLYDGSGRTGHAGDVRFGLQVSEQANMTIGVGGTRSAATAPGEEAASAPAVRTLEGEDSYGLAVHRMTLPFVGIHRGAVKSNSGLSENSENSEHSEHSATRAAAADMVSSTDTFHDSLTVWGFTRNAQTEIFNRTLVQRVTNWRTSGNWPYGESGLMRFYAVAPSLENINMVAADADYYTPPVLTYTLPEKAQDMCDLLYGDSDPIDIEAFGTKESHISRDDKYVNLQFQHILTAVRFAQGKIPTGIRITRIAINRVSPRATFSPAVTDPVTGTLGAWSGLGGTQVNYTMLADFTGTGTENTYLNDSVFYMLPQTVPANVELEVELEAVPKREYSKTGLKPTTYTGSETKKHTLKCPLTGDVWKKGYTVTYLLTIGEVQDGYYFLVDPIAENEHSSTATSHNFTVHSYNSYWDYESWTSGGTEGAEVTSHGVNWKVVGYYQNAECTTAFNGSDATVAPTWLTSGLTYNTEYTGGYNGNASYNLAAQSPVKGGNHETILGANPVASDMDLSNHNPDGTSKSAETANCYIINRTGSYKFPMVYGNKTTDGAEESYFVDHTGTVISHKNIKDQITEKTKDATYTYTKYVDEHTGETGYELERYRKAYSWDVGSSLRAVVVWQDKDGQITGVNAHAGDEYISFNVNYNTPSNAVIALQAKNLTKYEKRQDTSSDWVTDTSKGTSGFSTGEEWETLWTWHIWMTDEVYANEGTNNNFDSKDNDEMYLNCDSLDNNHLVSLKNYSGTTNTILPVNLGWVPQNMNFEYYAKREVYVKLEQLSSGNTAVAHIVQHARQPLVRGVGTFYQWGRPTALPGHNWPDDANPKTVRTIYRNTTDFTDFTVENITHPYDVIAQPTKLFRRSDQMVTWLSTDADYAYWGDGSTKTVYDPCPPGFQVPHYSVFSGFSMTGATAGKTKSDAEKLNMWDDAGENFFGGYFYVDPHDGTDKDYHIPDADRYDQTVYMPATGQYQATKGVGSQLSSSVAPNNNYIETSPGTVWTYGQDGDRIHGQALNLYPDYDRVHDTKPAIELPRKVNISTACAIRPVQK